MSAVQDIPRLLPCDLLGVNPQLGLQDLFSQYNTSIQIFTPRFCGSVYSYHCSVSLRHCISALSYLHQLHGDLVNLPAGVRRLEEHQVQQGDNITWVISESKSSNKQEQRPLTASQPRTSFWTPALHLKISEDLKMKLCCVVAVAVLVVALCSQAQSQSTFVRLRYFSSVVHYGFKMF